MDPQPREERRCRHLRHKGMYIDVEPDPEVPSMSDGFCWCTHTQNCLGPDGEAACHQDCTPERDCFEAL